MYFALFPAAGRESSLDLNDLRYATKYIMKKNLRNLGMNIYCINRSNYIKSVWNLMLCTRKRVKGLPFSCLSLRDVVKILNSVLSN